MKTCICKKEYERIQYNGYIIDFEKDKLYEYIRYYSNKEDKNYKHYMLYPDNEPISLDKDDFDEHFVDVQKLRKLKLQKINGIAGR
jgi:hypothetical protein